jgi:hypothetical protein
MIKNLWGNWHPLLSLICYDAFMLQDYDQMMIDMFLRPFLKPFPLLTSPLSSLLLLYLFSSVLSYPLSYTTTTTTTSCLVGVVTFMLYYVLNHLWWNCLSPITNTTLLLSYPLLLLLCFFANPLLSFALPMMKLSKSIHYMEYEPMILNLWGTWHHYQLHLHYLLISSLLWFLYAPRLWSNDDWHVSEASTTCTTTTTTSTSTTTSSTATATTTFSRI